MAATETTVALRCDMDHDCTEPIAYLDENGFIYCAPHGVDRQFYKRCRKLRPHELRRLERGQQVQRY